MSLIRINIKELKPGNRLAENVLSGKGILLAKKDQVVDPRLLEILKSFGLLDVAVVSPEDQGASSTPVAVSPEVQEKVKSRFKNLDLKSPVIQRLFDLCLERSSKKKASVTVHHIARG